MTPLLIEVTKSFRRGATTDVALPRVFPWWKGRRGDNKEGAAFSSNNPPLLKVNADRRGGGWGGGCWERKALCNIRMLLLF